MTMPAWTLLGTGARTEADWSSLREELDGWQAGWADLEGFHIQPLPPAPPLATHLWAWRSDGWLRVRIDGHDWVASALFRATVRESPLWSSNREQLTAVHTTEIVSWDRADGRVRQLVLANTTKVPKTMWQLTPVTARPVVFVGTHDTLS